MLKLRRLPVLVFALALTAAGPVPPRQGAYGLTAYPNAPQLCPAARASDLFQKCRNQAEVLAAAQALARSQGKALLIEIGADWCASCIVMDRYINGWFAPGKEPPAAGTQADAEALAAFMASNFVVARLNVDDPTTAQALKPLMRASNPPKLCPPPINATVSRADRPAFPKLYPMAGALKVASGSRADTGTEDDAV